MNAVITYLYVQWPSENTGKAYLCFLDNSPLPWEEDLVRVTDERGQHWFVHEYRDIIDTDTMNALLRKICTDFAPKTKTALSKRLRNPLIIQAFICQAPDFDTLAKKIGKYHTCLQATVKI